MKQLNNQALQLLIIGMFLLTNLVLGGFIIRRSFIAQNQRLQTIGYIKCVLLLRYDSPGLNEKSPRQDVEGALDRCAESVKK